MHRVLEMLIFVRNISDTLDVYVYVGTSQAFRILISIKEVLNTYMLMSSKTQQMFYMLMSMKDTLNTRDTYTREGHIKCFR